MSNNLGLITDRPVPHGGDQLGHDEVARQLANIALTVEVPANIALYGRWGAGKSSIANSLAKTIGESPGASWVKYDAFKWSGAAFHRHFLTQTATQLRVKFDPDDLYGEQSSTDLKFSWKDFWSSLWSSALFVLVLVGLVAGFFVLANWVANHLTSEAVQRLADTVLAPVTLLAAGGLMVKSLLGASMDTLKVKRTVSAPSGDEQFEEQFRTLVAEATKGGGRVVVFIDELDRCSAADVVETLDAIRTFLDVPGCVCIVAADKHALEKALSVAVAQETPRDATNPYYSTGGAYLDKVFAYQVALPAPLNGRLSSMASELVRTAGGVWKDVDDPDRIVSVLIPTHVTSPRRVKALLNAYAVAYRLMERKIAANVVEGPVAAREVELAKLVCLQVEFPLFARELATDDGLLGAVLDLARERSTSRQLRRSRTARKFLQAGLEVDVDISRQRPPHSGDGEDPTEAHRGEDGGDADPDDASGEGAAPTKISDKRPAADEVRLVDQLVSYLRKTRHVDDPRPDLIHLEATGSTRGLAPKLARELQDLAIDRSGRLADFVDALDPPDRIAAVLMLADTIRGAPGVEAENLIGSIFGLLGRWDAAALAEVADMIVDSVAADLHRVAITGEDRAGALVLGIAAGRPSRKRLLREALKDRAAILSPALGSRIVAHLGQLVSGDFRESAAEALGARLADPETAEAAGQALERLSDDAAFETAGRATTAIEDFLAPRPVPDEADEDDEDDDPEASDHEIAAYSGLLSQLDVSPACLWLLAQPLLSLDTKAGRDGFEKLLPRLGRTGTQEQAEAVLTAASKRVDQAEWLQAVDWTADLAVAAHLRTLVRSLWRKMASDDSKRTQNRANLHALADAVHQSGADVGGADTLPSALTDAEVPGDAEAAKSLNRQVAVTEQFIRAGLFDRNAVADVLRPIVLNWISAQPAVNNAQQVAAVQSGLRQQAPHMLDAVGLVCDDDDARDAMIAAVNEESRADDELRSLLLVHALTGDTEQLLNEVGPNRIASALESQGADAHRLVGDWVALGRPSAAVIREAVEEHDLLSGGRVAPLADALRRWSEQVATDELASFAGWVARDSSVADWALRACEPDRVDSDRLATEIVAAWQATTNNPGRKRVLDVWDWAAEQLADQRRRLIDEVFLDFLKLAQHNQQAAHMVAKYASLVEAPPHGTITRLREALKPLASGKDGRPVRRAYEQAGVLLPRKKGKKRRGLLGRG